MTVQPLVLARAFWRAARRLRRVAAVEMPAVLSVLWSRTRQPWHAVESWPDAGPILGPDVAVFVHFDPSGAVSRDVVKYLRALKDANLSVLLVSNNERLNPDALTTLKKTCAGILLRRNVGYDFGAMREALAHWRLPQPATAMLLLVNDSVLGPFAPLRPVLEAIDFAKAEIWGATDSLQRGHHLQSWFLAVGRKALNSSAWTAFWAGVRPVQNKEWVVGHYEVGLSRAMQQAGLRLRALWPYDSLLSQLDADESLPGTSGPESAQLQKAKRLLARGLRLNPTADLWRQLLRQGCPFLKRELVTRNTARVLDVDEWPQEVGARFGPQDRAM